MKRSLLTIAVSALVVAVSFGCAQVDYPCITDVSQTGDGSTTFVNTNGQAHIEEFTQSAVILPDGTTVEIVNFVNQTSNSVGTVSDLYNYQYRTASDDFEFHTDQYCSTDSNGCSAATNTDNAFCGADGKGGLKIASGPCSDGLGLLFGDSIRDSECGKAAVTDPVPQLAGLSLIEATNFVVSNGSLVDGAYEMSLNPAVTFTYEDGSSYPVAMPTIPTRVRLAPGFKFQFLYDISDAAFADVLYDIQDIADANPGSRFTISVDLFGQTLHLSGTFRLVDSELVPGFYADKAARLWGS